MVGGDDSGDGGCQRKSCGRGNSCAVIISKGGHIGGRD